MLSMKYYFIYHNTSTIILLTLCNLNYNTIDVIHVLICTKKDKFKNSKLENTLCLSFIIISNVQFKYHELRYTLVKAMEVTHRSDINFHLNYSALIKCQDNFRFKVKSDNTFAL